MSCRLLHDDKHNAAGALTEAGEHDVAGVAIELRGGIGGAGPQGGCGKHLQAERGQRARSVKPVLRLSIGINEPAVRHKGRGRIGVVIQEPLHALGQCQRRPRRLGRDNKYCPSAIGGDHPRTGTGQRAAEVAAEAAQAFQALLPAGRQCCGQAKHLRGWNFVDGKTPVGASA